MNSSASAGGFDWALARSFIAALEHGSLLGAARATVGAGGTIDVAAFQVGSWTKLGHTLTVAAELTFTGVPEPTTASLLAVAFGSLALASRRRA